MNKKETTIEDWVVAFLKGTSFWNNSVHADELLGKGKKGEVYYLKSFNLLANLIARANETGLIKTHYLSLSFYLKPSIELAEAKPNTSELWTDFSHMPPELHLIERTIETEKGKAEVFESPISLKELDKLDTLGASAQNIHAYYTCWRSQEPDDEEYERAVVVEYR